MVPDGLLWYGGGECWGEGESRRVWRLVIQFGETISRDLTTRSKF